MIMLDVVRSRDRLLREAIRLFGERGYHETTVGDVEDAAGLTRRAGGFYRHFASKEDVLVQAVRNMADEMVAEFRLQEIVSLKSPRAELLLIARALMRHAAAHRPLRLLLQREGHKLPALKKVARASNKRLATLDVIPWVENLLKRLGIRHARPRELALTIFGPVLLYIYSIDRGDPAFGVDSESLLDSWADHWASWFDRSAKS